MESQATDTEAKDAEKPGTESAPCPTPCYAALVDELRETISNAKMALGHVSHVATRIEQYRPAPKATSQRLYDLLCELREGIAAVRDSQTVTVQNDVDELDRLAGKANEAIGMIIKP